MDAAGYLRAEANRIRRTPDMYNQSIWGSIRVAIPIDPPECRSPCCIAGGIARKVRDLGIVTVYEIPQVALMALQVGSNMQNDIGGWLFTGAPKFLWPSPWSEWWDRSDEVEKWLVASDMLDRIADAIDEGVLWEEMFDHLERHFKDRTIAMAEGPDHGLLDSTF